MSTATSSTFFDKLRTPAECEKYFRLTRHTALLAARSGVIKSARRKHGKFEAFLIDPKDAYAFWGPR